MNKSDGIQLVSWRYFISLLIRMGTIFWQVDSSFSFYYFFFILKRNNAILVAKSRQNLILTAVKMTDMAPPHMTPTIYSNT